MPRQPGDQAAIAGIVNDAGNTVSGLNEHGLAHELWALAEQIRACMTMGHRYVRCHCDISQRHCVMHAEHTGVPREEVLEIFKHAPVIDYADLRADLDRDIDPEARDPWAGTDL